MLSALRTRVATAVIAITRSMASGNAASVSSPVRNLTWLYLGGPMRGYPLHNFPAFNAAAERLRAEGYEVFSPAQSDLDDGFDPARTIEEQGFDLKEALLADLTWIICHAEALILLPGWEKSSGTLAEVHTAWCLDIPVYELEDFLAGFLFNIKPGVLYG